MNGMGGSYSELDYHKSNLGYYKRDLDRLPSNLDSR